jgi:plasmid stabilization system protein ParE
VRVELSDEAHAQVQEIDVWWRDNRLASPDLFTAELDQALAVLEASPALGSPYVARATRVRRLLLPRTHYHLYLVDGADRVLVVAVWGAFRGRGPRV